MSRLAKIYYDMRRRCEDPRASAFASYGGRGVIVSPEWFDYESFKAWAQCTDYSDDLTLERIDNNGPYAPSNCRWATRKEQARNRSDTIRLPDGRAAIDVAESNGICWLTLRGRIYNSGWSVEDACTQPLRKGVKIKETING